MIESKDTHSVTVENERLRYDNSDLLAQADADSHVIRQLEDLVTAYKAKLEEAAKVLERTLIGNPTIESPEDHVQYLAGCIESALANLKGAE